MDFYSSSQKICKSEFEFFIFKFSSSAKKTEFIEFKIAFQVKIKTKTIKPRPKHQKNGLKTGYKTNTGLKSYVTAKYYLLLARVARQGYQLVAPGW